MSSSPFLDKRDSLTRWRTALKAIAVGHIEDEGDLVYQNALRRLFLEEPNGRYTVTWTRLFDQMENLLDACDNTAGVVRSVVLKGA